MRIRWVLQIVISVLMLSNCANPGKVASTQNDPAQLQARLEAAIDAQDVDSVRSAIAAGARADRPLPSRQHPITRAVILEDVAIVRLLLRSGADSNQLDGLSSRPPLAAAVHAHNRALVDELVKAGADPNKRFGVGLGLTVLGEAAVAVGGGAIIPLIDAGADVNAWNLVPASAYPQGYRVGKAEGRTPLMLAAAQGQYINVLMLLDRRADPTLRNEHGKTALDLMGDPTADLREALTHPEQFNTFLKR